METKKGKRSSKELEELESFCNLLGLDFNEIVDCVCNHYLKEYIPLQHLLGLYPDDKKQTLIFVLCPKHEARFKICGTRKIFKRQTTTIGEESYRLVQADSVVNETNNDVIERMILRRQIEQKKYALLQLITVFEDKPYFHNGSFKNMTIKPHVDQTIHGKKTFELA